MSTSTDPLELVSLRAIMALTRGREDVVIGLVDGPVNVGHPDLAAHVHAIARTSAPCRDMTSPACRHGTFVAGILAAERETQAPAIAPGCTVLVRAIFHEEVHGSTMPAAQPGQLAEAIVDCIDAGAGILNMSVAVTGRPFGPQPELRDALDYASRRGALIFAAAGNQGEVLASTITRHPWVIAVAAYKQDRTPLPMSNIGRAIGIGGVGAPGEAVRSLSPAGGPVTASGTSVAVPVASGAAALLWSLSPEASASEIRYALLASSGGGPRGIVPPLFDAREAHNLLVSIEPRRVAL